MFTDGTDPLHPVRSTESGSESDEGDEGDNEGTDYGSDCVVTDSHVINQGEVFRNNYTESEVMKRHQSVSNGTFPVDLQMEDFRAQLVKAFDICDEMSRNLGARNLPAYTNDLDHFAEVDVFLQTRYEELCASRSLDWVNKNLGCIFCFPGRRDGGPGSGHISRSARTRVNPIDKCRAWVDKHLVALRSLNVVDSERTIESFNESELARIFVMCRGSAYHLSTIGDLLQDPPANSLGGSSSSSSSITNQSESSSSSSSSSLTKSVKSSSSSLSAKSGKSSSSSSSDLPTTYTPRRRTATNRYTPSSSADSGRKSSGRNSSKLSRSSSSKREVLYEPPTKKSKTSTPQRKSPVKSSSSSSRSSESSTSGSKSSSSSNTKTIDVADSSITKILDNKTLDVEGHFASENLRAIMPYINNLNHFVEVVDTLRQGMLRVAQMASAGASAHNEAQRINNDNQMMDDRARAQMEQVSKDRAELDQQKKEFADYQKDYNVKALCQQIAELAAERTALQQQIILMKEIAAEVNNDQVGNEETNDDSESSNQVDNEERKDESESKEDKKDSSTN